MPPKLTNKEIPLSAIRISPKHWGRSITQKDISDLADNISRIGQLHQIAVRPAGKSKKMYELLAGQRRYEALRSLGHKTARCIIVNADDDRAGFLSISENLCQKPMTSKELEEAAKKLDEYYTRLFAREDAARADRDKEDRRERTKNILKGPPKGARTKPKTQVREAVAKDLGVSPRTVRRAMDRSENLIAAASRAHDRGLITDAQADLLAKMEPDDQRSQLPKMIDETAADSRRRLDTERQVIDRGPTNTMGGMVKEIIKICSTLKKQLSECVKFHDGRDIDYEEIRKQPIDRMEECAGLLSELMQIIG